MTGLRRVGVAGLTLIETLMALIMLSLLIVAVLGLLGSLLVASTKSSDNTAGVIVAQEVLDDAEFQGYPTDRGGSEPLHLVDGTWKGVKLLYSHEDNIPVQFRYDAVWDKIGDADVYKAGSETKPVQYGPNLYRVEVTVYWMVDDPDKGRAEGGGLRTVKLERMVTCPNQAGSK